MQEIYIKIKDLNDFKYVKDYFNNKDIISIEDILSAFDWELERQLPKETEWTEEDKQWAYECEQAEERKLQEYEGE